MFCTTNTGKWYTSLQTESRTRSRVPILLRFQVQLGKTFKLGLKSNSKLSKLSSRNELISVLRFFSFSYLISDANRNTTFNHRVSSCSKCTIQGYQQIGSTTRSCPSKYGNSNSWSGDAVRCEPINETAARQIGRQMCFKMEPSDENIRVKCEPGDMYGEIQD